MSASRLKILFPLFACLALPAWCAAQQSVTGSVTRARGRKVVRRQVATEREIDTVFGLERVRIDVDVAQPGRFFQSLKSFLADDSYHGTNVFGRFYTIEQLVALFLGEMRRRAQERLDRPIDRATIGRPVH